MRKKNAVGFIAKMIFRNLTKKNEPKYTTDKYFDKRKKTRKNKLK